MNKKMAERKNGANGEKIDAKVSFNFSVCCEGSIKEKIEFSTSQNDETPNRIILKFIRKELNLKGKSLSEFIVENCFKPYIKKEEKLNNGNK